MTEKEMEEGVGLTKVFIEVWMLLKKDSVYLELEFVDFLAFNIFVHSHGELVAIVNEVERDDEGLSIALGMPALLGFAIDVESDYSAS